MAAQRLDDLRGARLVRQHRAGELHVGREHRAQPLDRGDVPPRSSMTIATRARCGRAPARRTRLRGRRAGAAFGSAGGAAPAAPAAEPAAARDRLGGGAGDAALSPSARAGAGWSPPGGEALDDALAEKGAEREQRERHDEQQQPPAGATLPAARPGVLEEVRRRGRP